MVDEATLTQAARELLQNPAFNQAVDTLRDRYVQAILGSASNDQEQREECYRRVSVLLGVITELADISQNPMETTH